MSGFMTITRVSVDSAGNQAIGSSSAQSISADGRFVVFESDASNLVPGDTSNKDDIFVRDTLANTTTRVSVDSAGNQGNSGSGAASISADGRFVTFSSVATNLVPGDTNNKQDIFVRDTLANTTTRVSVDSAGNQANNTSFRSSISANGRFVVFSSEASNLVPGETNNSTDIFVRDTLANTTTRVSISSTGDGANDGSYRPSISADGRFVTFDSDASNLVPGDTNNSTDIFVRDLSTNAITLVSVGSSGERGNDNSFNSSISANGRFVAFHSKATNLVPGDTNNSRDIFVRDLLTNTTTLISVSSSGERGNGDSFNLLSPGAISADGRFVVFESAATNLVPGDTNGNQDIFVRDTLANTTTRVSVNSAGNEGNSISYITSISPNGQKVGFSSAATNLVPGDTNFDFDIFVVDLTNTSSGINNSPNAINGTPGNDNLTGTNGNDNINGFDGDDALTGLRSNDILVGGGGSDNLSGGKGFDTLNGGLGNDILVGGAGNDLFVLGAGLGVDTISDFTNSQDTLQLINGLTFGQLSISPGTNGTLIRAASSGEVLASLTGVAPNLIGSEDFISG
jgi:Ca2+-binding RTX toxin-like protein